MEEAVKILGILRISFVQRLSNTCASMKFTAGLSWHANSVTAGDTTNTISGWRWVDGLQHHAVVFVAMDCGADVHSCTASEDCRSSRRAAAWGMEAGTCLYL